jgi:hypothetical protein
MPSPTLHVTAQAQTLFCSGVVPHTGGYGLVVATCPEPDAGHPLHSAGGHGEVSMIRNMHGMISAARTRAAES